MVTISSLESREDKIAVVGLGYVGLPLAVHLSNHFEVVGFDLKKERVKELQEGHDRTLEVEDASLKTAKILYTTDASELEKCRFIIVAVPTPIDDHRNPDLGALEGASRTVGRHLAKGSCIVFESTVFPGATEEVCLPIIQDESNLRLGTDFALGYSPERINPGDKEHTLSNIVKIISGSDDQAFKVIEGVYGKIVSAGLHKASCIKVAEAAKVIENTQRDLNIALMNELSMIFDRMGIDTIEVLEAAGTKWNFLPFRPGLVGGHCIGVDPYYLTFKAEYLGYHPEMILAGRRINDNMAKVVAEKLIKMLIRTDKTVRGAKVAVLGITFKKNVPDLRNTKVVDILSELEDYGIETFVHDPLADPAEAKRYYGVELVELDRIRNMDGVVVAVFHDAYRKLGYSGITGLCGNGKPPVIVDVMGNLGYPPDDLSGTLYWRL